jgi:hypothetical protein
MGHMGPYGVPMGHMGPIWPMGHLDPHGAHMGPNGPIWAHFGPSLGPAWATIWVSLEDWSRGDFHYTVEQLGSLRRDPGFEAFASDLAKTAAAKRLVSLPAQLPRAVPIP